MLERWGFNLKNQAYISWDNVEKISYQRYLDRLKDDMKAKRVYVIPSDGLSWNEAFLTKWFEQNYHLIEGIEQIYSEHTLEYNKIKMEMQFYGFPDFLGLIKNKFYRIEIECFPCGYHHTEDYCEIVLCYELNAEISKKQKWYGLKELLGYEEIIHETEILDYMFQKYEDFKKEVTNKIMESWTRETE